MVFKEYTSQLSTWNGLEQIGYFLSHNLAIQTSTEWIDVHALIDFHWPSFDYHSTKYVYDYSLIFHQGNIGFVLFKLI